ncbi:hypothetical protein [Desulfurivibrio sp. C05AmB]|uniref:hypothetical protein n=1 Tax=Desulfurivibrio sp. C05AmB TaxID=3374371 RepID=UPI00376EB7D6
MAPESGAKHPFEARKAGAGERNVLAVASLTLGLSGLLAFVLIRPLAFLPAIAGLVLGILGLRVPSQRWMAIVGIVLCLLLLVVEFGLLALLLKGA